MAPLLPIVWMKLFLIKTSYFFVISRQGAEQRAGGGNPSTAGSMNCSFLLYEIPKP